MSGVDLAIAIFVVIVAGMFACLTAVVRDMLADIAAEHGNERENGSPQRTVER